MITFRKLCGEDVEMLDERLAADTDGAARITVRPSPWWELVRADPHRHGWIIEDHGEAIGYLDAEDDAVDGTTRDFGPADVGRATGVTYLALLLFPAARGRGLAHEVLGRALRLAELARASTLVAYVEPDNRAARRTLLGAGFVENGTDADGLIEHLRRGTAASLVET